MASPTVEFAHPNPTPVGIPWLGIAGILLVICAGIVWRVTALLDGPEAAAQQFFEAVLADDIRAMRNGLIPELRGRVDDMIPDSAAKNSRGIHTRVTTKLLRQGDGKAEVQATITRQGFSIKPHLFLQHQSNGTWLVSEIDHLTADERWEQAKDSDRRASDESLADELAKAFGSRKE